MKNLQSSVRSLQSSVRSLQSSVRSLQSSVHSLQFSVRNRFKLSFRLTPRSLGTALWALCSALCALLFALLFQSCDTVTDNNPVNNLNSLPVLNFYVTHENLVNIYDNRFTDLEIPAEVDYNDKKYEALMEASGAGSRYFPKYSFKVMVEDDYLLNLNEFSISSQVFDKTYVKTVLAIYMYNAINFPVFNSQPVFVKMNSENWGLYSFIERIDYNFFLRRNIPVYELYQVKFDSKFTFSRKNIVQKNFEKEIPNNNNFEYLEEMIYAVDTVKPENILTQLDKYIDVEHYLMYHAMTSIRHDPDAFTNNFYLYKETPGSPFKIVPWDFDKTFDTIGYVDFYGSNDLIDKLFLSKECRQLYKEYVKYILDNIFTEENLYPIIDNLADKIKPFYKYDPFLENVDFENELNKVKKFITDRRAYMYEQLEKFE